MTQSSNPDPFDDLLTLEDTLYTSAYQLGTQDGAHAGRIEGRIFGLEKGFEKFTALGSLHGRAVVWASRVPSQSHHSPAKNESEKDALPAFKENERLKKNVQMLHGLTDPETFSTLNSEEAVADFDDRFKRAGAKAKIIERTIGESSNPRATSDSPEDNSPKRQGRSVKLSGREKKKGDDSMEDFTGSRFLS